MKAIDKSSKKQEIYSLLTVVFAGVIGAMLLTLAMTLYYTTEGTYRATNVVIEPSLLPTIRYVDQEVGGRGDKSSYLFDKITYMAREGDPEQLRTMNLTMPQYEAIYAMLSGDTSVRDASEELDKHFGDGRGATLSIVMKNAAHQSYYTLTRIEFSSDGDYYRAQLRGNGPKEQWAYFFHPKVLTLLTQIVNK